MINLPPADLMLLRTIKKAAVLLFLFRQVDPEPLTGKEIANILEINRETTYHYISTLNGCGFIEFVSHISGFRLTDTGKDFLSFQLSLKNRLKSGNSQLNETLEVVDILSNSYLVDSTKSGENRLKAENPTLAFSLSDVLAYAPKLFNGSAVSGSGLERVDPLVALQWMAYAWKERQNLTAPCGLIYSRLKSRAKPPAETDIRILPNSMLAALGFEIPKLEKDEETEPEPEQQESIRRDESVTEPVIALWESIKERLSEELPRASFETWVRDTSPVKYNGALWVGTRNAYNCEWLENKLAEVVNRMLEEAGEKIPVKFVVTELESEEA